MNSFSGKSRALRTMSRPPSSLAPRRAFESPNPEPAGRDTNQSLYMEYYRTLVRHWWLVAALAGVGFLGSYLVNLTTLPVYRSRTSLDIQSMNEDFMNLKTVAPTAAGTGPDDSYMPTQIRLLESDTLLKRTVDSLEDAPHLPYVARGDTLSRLLRGLHLPGAAPLTYEEMLDYTSKHLTVRPLGITRLVEVSCDSWSAEFAARFCTELVEQFRETDLQTRGEESQQTSQILMQQVGDAKRRAEDSEKKLEVATGGNGLLLTQEITGVAEGRLHELETAYVRAQADRMEKQATAGMAAVDPTSGQNSSYRAYEQTLADLRGQIARLEPPLTEEAPKIIHLREQIKNVEGEMATSRAAGTVHLTTDYQVAANREAMLGAAYRAQEGAVSADQGKEAQVALLRGEVDANEKLYETLLQRAREAGFATALKASTIRVVDAAKVPEAAFSPDRGNAAACGVLLGLFGGVGLAFFRERNTTVFRTPGETERYLGLRELGVIPSMAQGRSLLTQNPLKKQATGSAYLNWNDNFSIVAEAYRSASVSLVHSDSPLKQGRVYVVSSPNAGEGKTTVSSNLGVSLSKSRLRVLLIDGDLRKPSLHKALDVPNEVGLRDLLRREGGGIPDSLDEFYKETSAPNLYLMTAGQGTEDSVELLHSVATGELVHRLRGEFDVVIIDSPPMLHMADARILASHAQGAILVLRAGLTTREDSAKARHLLEQDRIRTVGTILNDFNPRKNGLHNYYGSYYKYKDEVTGAAKKASAKAGLAQIGLAKTGTADSGGASIGGTGSGAAGSGAAGSGSASSSAAEGTLPV